MQVHCAHSCAGRVRSDQKFRGGTVCGDATAAKRVFPCLPGSAKRPCRCLPEKPRSLCICPSQPSRYQSLHRCRKRSPEKPNARHDFDGKPPTLHEQEWPDSDAGGANGVSHLSQTSRERIVKRSCAWLPQSRLRLPRRLIHCERQTAPCRTCDPASSLAPLF